MDCGPAALKCLLDGFGLPASYGRLREACQTDVDGTSIDTLEDLANDVGLLAEQVLLPVDHVLASSRSEEHTSELQSLAYLVCRLLLEKKNAQNGRSLARLTK